MIRIMRKDNRIIICISFIQRRSTASTLVQHCINVIQMCFCLLGCPAVRRMIQTDQEYRNSPRLVKLKGTPGDETFSLLSILKI